MPSRSHSQAVTITYSPKQTSLRVLELSARRPPDDLTLGCLDGLVLRLINAAKIIERRVSAAVFPHAGARDFDPREPAHGFAGLVPAFVDFDRWF